LAHADSHDATDVVDVVVTPVLLAGTSLNPSPGRIDDPGRTPPSIMNERFENSRSRV
jgi:hypothetical protein